ncbi:hypothetical protein BSKO_07000 [Bryopsis sp. KO-2023]|nr:hypothetical protein BSKO_07000 [Bryopsis sp. KO-2023]
MAFKKRMSFFSSKKGVRNLGCPLELLCDDSRDSLPDPRGKVFRWSNDAKTFPATDTNLRLELLTWSDSDEEEGDSYRSETSTPTSEDTALFVGNLRRAKSHGAESSCGNGGVVRLRALFAPKSSPGSGIQAVTGVGDKLRRACKGVHFHSQRKPVRECALRKSLKQEGNDNRGQEVTAGGCVANEQEIRDERCAATNRKRTIPVLTSEIIRKGIKKSRFFQDLKQIWNKNLGRSLHAGKSLTTRSHGVNQPDNC